MTTLTRPTMTDEQRVAYQALLDYITGKDTSHSTMVFTGYAGTGKSFTLAQVVAALNSLGSSNVFDSYRVAISAPTHKAVRVMRRFAAGLRGVTFATIHSLLGLKEEIDNNGKQKFVQSKDPDQIRIEGFDVVFVDEVSMLADELFHLLMPYVRDGLKLVFIGDPKQIPPVNHVDAIPLLPGKQQEHHIGQANLETIMRQALDNPILTYATRIRKAESTESRFPVETHLIIGRKPGEAPSGIVAVANNDREKIEMIIDEMFNCEQFKQDADHAKIIAWRNVTVDEFNRIVRKHIYREAQLPEGVKELPFIMPGEKLIVDKPVIIPPQRKVLLTTNEELEVLRYEVKEMEVPFFTAKRIDNTWQGEDASLVTSYYNTWVRYFDEDGDEAECNIRILHEKDRARVNAAVQQIATAAQAVAYTSPLRTKLWRSFYDLQQFFAQVKYNYAVTSHKAQGSTYETAMVIDWDLAMNRRIEERNRIRYVAATRARSLLYVVS